MQDDKKLSIEWIDRIFHRFKEIYAQEYDHLFSNNRSLVLQKEIYRSGLCNLKPQEIKHAIECCRIKKQSSLPNVIIFHRLAKLYKEPLLAKPGDKEIAKNFINEIRDKLNAKT